MKNLLLAAVAFIAFGMAANAQSYDEVQLLGQWTVENQEGNLNNEFSSVASIYFGDRLDSDVVEEGYPCSGIMVDLKDLDGYLVADQSYEYASIEDFFISNNNKLHIHIRGGYGENIGLRFVIDKFEGDELILHSFDNKCKLTLRRTGGAGVVEAVDVETHDNVDAVFSIAGTMVKNPENGIYVVRKNGKTSKQLIR